MRLCLGIGLLLALAGTGSAQDTNFSTGPQYLMTLSSPMFAQSIATPSLSWESTLPVAATSEPSASQAPAEQYEVISSILESQRQTALYSIYYGTPAVSVTDITFRQPVGEGSTLSTATVEVGVTSLTDAQALREQGYGVTLAEAAASRKARTSHGHHVYTNEDVERLRPPS